MSIVLSLPPYKNLIENFINLPFLRLNNGIICNEVLGNETIGRCQCCFSVGEELILFDWLVKDKNNKKLASSYQYSDNSIINCESEYARVSTYCNLCPKCLKNLYETRNTLYMVWLANINIESDNRIEFVDMYEMALNQLRVLCSGRLDLKNPEHVKMEPNNFGHLEIETPINEFCDINNYSSPFRYRNNMYYLN